MKKIILLTVLLFFAAAGIAVYAKSRKRTGEIDPVIDLLKKLKVSGKEILIWNSVKGKLTESQKKSVLDYLTWLQDPTKPLNMDLKRKIDELRETYKIFTS